MKQTMTNTRIKLSDIEHVLPINNDDSHMPWQVRAVVEGLLLALVADTPERKEAVAEQLEQLKQLPGMNQEVWEACQYKALELIELAMPTAAPALPDPTMPALQR